MDAQKLLADLRDALRGVEATSQSTVQVEALRKYLENWENSAKQVQKATDKHHARQLEEWKLQLSVSSASWLEMFKAVIEAGQTTLKSSIVINGGAAAAILALLAEGLKANGENTWQALLSPLGYAWLIFMIGLGSAGSATAARYVSQAFYAESLRLGEDNKVGRWYRWGNYARNVAVSLGLSSYLLFFYGSIRIYWVMVASSLPS